MAFILIWQYHIFHLFFLLSIPPLWKCKLLRAEIFLVLLCIVSTVLSIMLNRKYLINTCWKNDYNCCTVVHSWGVGVARKCMRLNSHSVHLDGGLNLDLSWFRENKIKYLIFFYHQYLWLHSHIYWISIYLKKRKLLGKDETNNVCMNY